ncbi:MAG: F0F1 ATP synthase subunit delta [Tannerella sp.]|jgi:F-type H+-transporting ATPase subunit delta|nr:F0F1 ATP synthase subunit delta [Tannerella sp.]
MNEGLISKRYARALYRHAAKLGEENVLYHRMLILEELLCRMPQLRERLKSPVVKPREKLSLLQTATGKNAEQSYLDFAELVVANERCAALRMITLSYQQIYRKMKNISVVHLVSAKKMSFAAIEKIRRITEQQTHGTVEFSNHIDPAIDGGFILQFNDLRIDASVRGQLQQIERKLMAMNRSMI